MLRRAVLRRAAVSRHCSQLAFAATRRYTASWLKPVACPSGREPTFLLAVKCSDGAGSGDAWRMELERIRDAAERAAASAGVEVVDVEWKVGKQRFLRVYIDKPEGVSHRDCQAVSEQLGVLLDVEDLVPGSALRSGSQLAGSGSQADQAGRIRTVRGRLARISTTEPVENAKFFEGRLAGYADGRVKIEVQGRMIELPLAAIRKANLVVEL